MILLLAKSFQVKNRAWWAASHIRLKRPQFSLTDKPIPWLGNQRKNRRHRHLAANGSHQVTVQLRLRSGMIVVNPLPLRHTTAHLDAGPRAARDANREHLVSDNIVG